MIICKKPLTARELYEIHRHWHAWFAWFPVPVAEGMAWLQRVERRATDTSLEDYGGMVYEYRSPA